MRILIWFQFYLTLFTMVVAAVVASILEGHVPSVVTPNDPIEHQAARAVWLVLLLACGAILLAIAAASVRRGFLIAFPIVILAELALLVNLGIAVFVGIVVGITAALLIILGGWIVADLFRGEVRTFLFSRHRRPADA